MRMRMTLVVPTVLALLVPPLAVAQDHGSGMGDMLGDLIHIQRDAATGVPILAQRWVELPAEVQGYGWGYCPIAVDAAGTELGFAPLSCDVAPADLARVVEVDYFGRLSGGRTKERNSRMHFDEVITNIKDATRVGLDEAGRMKLEFCTTTAPVVCEWKVIDSPMENLALYLRVMKHGHIGTGAMEEDLWAHGDPAAGTQYHPALDAADYAKLQGRLASLVPPVPEACSDPGADADDCLPDSLEPDDFVLAASFLGGAANKDGKITVDLVQYMNRILKITKDTTGDPSGGSWPNPDTLPALVRDCWEGEDPPQPIEGQDPDDPAYANCGLVEADATLPNYTDFPVVKERFVDYGALSGYRRADWHAHTMTLLNGPKGSAFVIDKGVVLMDWLAVANGKPPAVLPANVAGFVAAGSDALRSVELIHNYAIPDPLWDFKKVK